VIWILTTLPRSVSALAVMGLYRLRWQIELLFRRLKSLLHLDTGLRPVVAPAWNQ